MAYLEESFNRPLPEPVIVLIEPQLGENIGMTARAMLNCGLTQLRLVRPREDWPNPKAASAASGATTVLEQARVFSTTPEALADLTHIYATTGRTRDMVKEILTPRYAAECLVRHQVDGERAGILFGPERTGLHNDDVALAHRVITAPVNPQFSSLNLAQSVLVVAYEWFQALKTPPPHEMKTGASPAASHQTVMNVLEHLETELDAHSFFSTPEKRPGMVRNIRNAFLRMHMTDQEARTLHGIITALAGRSRPKK